MVPHCVLKEGDAKPVCWGQNSRSQVNVPENAVWNAGVEPSCLMWDSELTGPASCTKCHADCHHTITSPKTNAGMCSKEFCPMCKPKAMMMIS